MKKLLLLTGTLVLITGTTVGLVLNNKEQPAQTNQTANATPTQNQKPTQTDVSYKGVAGKNALELLKQSHAVESKTYDGLGELVTSIDGVTPDSQHFWSLYVNGQQSQVGADAYVTQPNDTIAWKLEKIQ